MPFTTVATVQDVPPGKSKLVSVGSRKMALFNVNGTFYAIDDTCPHRGGPLSEGELEGNVVTCPWHGAQFDVTTGRNLSPPARSDVASYPVQLSGNDVQVDVPA
jgi:nitrite reductase (NADH) small subunit/3-phenylpropionate/trans-cinnamate dioxygenase ferredoxin subunit